MPDLRLTPDLLPGWWHEPWCQAVVESYDAVGPSATAALLGVSPSMVTAVARGYYESSLERIRTASRERLMAEEVDCPVLGPALPLVDCAGHRSRPFAATNPARVRLWRACRRCPHNPDAAAPDAATR